MRSEILRHGRELEQSGQWDLAEQLYRSALQREPDWTEGVYRLGVVYLQKKDLATALRCFEAVRGASFRVADTWNLSGIALAWQSKHSDAIFAFQQAIQSSPEFPDPYINLSHSLMVLGRLDEAEQSLLQLLQRHAHHMGALERLASLFSQRGESEKAKQAYEFILRLDPNHARAQLALGVLVAKQCKFLEALPLLEKACLLAPDSYEAFSNYGNCLREVGHLDRALQMLTRAVELHPNDATVHQNLGILWSKLNRPDQAIQHFEASLASMPQNAEAVVGIGAVELAMGDHQKAQATFERALAMDPNLSMARFNLAQIQIANGDFEIGFQNYESRWFTSLFTRRHFTQPTWSGESLPNSRLFIYCEQGFGDSIQFIRYAEWARKRVAQVIVEAPKRLIPLLSTCKGVDLWTHPGQELPQFDCQIALLSLPFVMKTTIENIPVSIPYLHADPMRVRDWAPRLRSKEKLLVGLAWQGNPTHQQDALRSIPLRNLLPLVSPEVQFVSLQKPNGQEIWDGSESKFDFLPLGKELDSDGAFLDTAAIITQLDLVISIDSAIAHLAGALGAPVWVPLIKAADWRWMRNRTDTPWYPSMKLFRQKQVGDWSDVIESIRIELAAIASAALLEHS